MTWFMSENNETKTFSLSILTLPIGVPGAKIPSFPEV